MTDKKELKEEKLEKDLKEEELEKVDGGYVFHDRYGSGKWQVIDDIHGGIRDYEYLSKQAAQEAAAKKVCRLMRFHGTILISSEKNSIKRTQNGNVSSESHRTKSKATINNEGQLVKGLSFFHSKHSCKMQFFCIAG